MKINQKKDYNNNNNIVEVENFVKAKHKMEFYNGSYRISVIVLRILYI